jgi:hypothetical protein
MVALIDLCAISLDEWACPFATIWAATGGCPYNIIGIYFALDKLYKM